MTKEVVDIIIPVHNQTDLAIQCIESILNAECSVPHEVIVIDDASTDPELKRRLEAFARAKLITLLENEQNMGFTRSVNHGISLHGERDVLLLNSDTIVYRGWLDRIAACACSGSRIASVNPMTNQRGSHISCYPGLTNPYDGKLEIGGENLNRIAGDMNAGKCVAVHTTVGFCMYIRRACLKDIGRFDSAHFPVAYGEESDFCYRARKAGWRHLVAGDVFVTHLEGSSFNDRKKGMMEKMLEKFVVLHPEVTVLDARFRERDPIRLLRYGIDLGRVRDLLEGRNDISIFISGESSNQRPPGALTLEYNLDERKVHFVIAENPESFPNLCSFRLPGDLSSFNHTMRSLGIATLRYRSDACRDSIEQATRGLPCEVGLGPRMVAMA